MPFSPKDLQGSIPALITPMKDGAVDEAAFRHLVRWQIEQMHRELKQLVGTEKCQCRHARSQRNHLACCYLAWLALKMRARQVATTLYAAKANLLRDFLMAELRKPTIRAYGIA